MIKKCYFKTYDLNQIFLLEMKNAVLTNLSKKFLWNSKTFRSIYETIRKPLYRTHPLNVLSHTNDAFSTSFLKSFRQKTGTFEQPTKMIPRTISSSKCSFRHIECSSDNIAKMIKKSLAFFALKVQNWSKKEFFGQNCFPSKCFPENIQCSFDNHIERRKLNEGVTSVFAQCPQMKKNFFSIIFLLKTILWAASMQFRQLWFKRFADKTKRFFLKAREGIKKYFFSVICKIFLKTFRWNWRMLLW